MAYYKICTAHQHYFFRILDSEFQNSEFLILTPEFS